MGLGILKLLHVAFGATWFGVGLLATGDARRTAELGGAHLAPLYQRLLRIALIARISAIGVLLSGVGLILMSGGFAHVAVRYHIALGLTLVAAGLGAAMGKIVLGMQALGDSATPQVLQPRVKKLTALAGAHQLLWILILACMVLPLERL